MRNVFVLFLALLGSCASATVATIPPKVPSASPAPAPQPEPGWIHFVFHPVRGTPHSDLPDDQFFAEMARTLSFYVYHPQTRHSLPPEQVGRPIILRTPKMAIHLPIQVYGTPQTVEVAWCTWGLWQMYLHRGHKVEHVGSCWSQELSVPTQGRAVVHFPPVRWWTHYEVVEFRQAWWKAGQRALDQRDPAKLRTFANNLRAWGESEGALGEILFGIAIILEETRQAGCPPQARSHFQIAINIWKARHPYLSRTDKEALALTKKMLDDCSQ